MGHRDCRAWYLGGGVDVAGSDLNVGDVEILALVL
jgi:hypothetical protein